MKLFSIILMILLLVNCFVEEKNPEASEVSAIRLGDDSDVNDDSDSYFDKCKESWSPLRTEMSSRGDSHVIAKEYKYKKNKRGCITLNIGRYIDKRYVRDAINRIEELDSYGKPAREIGSFDAVQDFMDRTGVTCEPTGDVLKLIFPTHPSDRHEIYKEIELHCGRGHKTRVSIGLLENTKRAKLKGDINIPSDNRGIGVIVDVDKGNGFKRTIFGTNSDGEIVTHIQPNGDMPLDRYGDESELETN